MKKIGFKNDLLHPFRTKQILHFFNFDRVPKGMYEEINFAFALIWDFQKDISCRGKYALFSLVWLSPKSAAGVTNALSLVWHFQKGVSCMGKYALNESKNKEVSRKTKCSSLIIPLVLNLWKTKNRNYPKCCIMRHTWIAVLSSEPAFLNIFLELILFPIEYCIRCTVCDV